MISVNQVSFSKIIYLVIKGTCQFDKTKICFLEHYLLAYYLLKLAYLVNTLAILVNIRDYCVCFSMFNNSSWFLDIVPFIYFKSRLKELGMSDLKKKKNYRNQIYQPYG